MSSERRSNGPLFLISDTSEASTRSSGDWLQPSILQHSQDVTLVRSLADSLLGSISKITDSMASQEAEKETFIEIGCYFYRASMAITELKTTERTPPNAVEILRSLSESMGSAADLVNGLGNGSEPGIVASKLEEVIRSVGERLISIPSSVYEDEEYAGVAIRSLSRDMLSSGAEKTEPIETDLYAVNMEDSPLPNTSAIITSSRRSQVKYEKDDSGNSLAMLPQLAQYMEPLFASFSCPLTKKVMDDPVTIETGVTYERRAISEWFETHTGDDEILCPSGNRLSSRAMNPNMALRSTIEEWKERNETARIKVARAALALASSESMVFEAVKDVIGICERNLRRKAQVFGSGMLPLLSKNLQHPSHDVPCAVLELLILLAEEDDESKELVAEDLDLGALITLLSSDYQPARHASLALILELSKSESKSLCEGIGSVPGAILTLIAIKYRSSTDAFASEEASKALKNFERSTNNIKRMAENGFFEPLLSGLSQGGEETKTEMASCLGKNESTSEVAESASPTLIAMIRTGSSLARRAAFKALSMISLRHSNSEALTRAGTVHAMTEEMFTRTIHDELFDSKSAAAAIIANVFESGPAIVDLECHVIRNVILLLKSSDSDESLSTSLVRILLCLAKIPRSMPVIVSAVQETDASLVLFEHMSSRDEFLAVAATKLLAALSATEIGDSLAERLCETRGQPESLVAEMARGTSEKRAASAAELLAKLPHHSLALNLALLYNNAVPVIINAITTSRPGSGSRPSLVGALVRFTATLHDPAILSAARAHNFTALLTHLLSPHTSGDEIQRLSAVGLTNLSSESVGLKVWLSKPLSPLAKKKQTVLLRVFSSRSKRRSPAPENPIVRCPVHHGGECSAAATFCLVEAGAVEPLMSCLGSESDEVVGAALSALRTLLDDGVDADGGARMLTWRFDAVRRVARVVRESRDEGVRRQSLWVVERLLERGGSDVAGDDRSLAASLVGAFRDGDAGTSQMAENILRRLNKMPSSAANYYST